MRVEAHEVEEQVYLRAALDIIFEVSERGRHASR
jgi:hypothetical protein